MSEEFEDSLDQHNQEIHESFAKKVIREVKSGQRTFGTPDHELVKPAIDEIRKGTARAFIVAVETKDGIRFYHKSVGSERLMELLNEGDIPHSSNPAKCPWTEEDHEKFEAME